MIRVPGKNSESLRDPTFGHKVMDVDLIKKIPVPSNLTHRVGRFSIKDALLRSDPDAFLILSAQIIVVRCEYMFRNDGFEYIALSPLFDEVEPGSMAPDYRIEINLDTREVKVFRGSQFQDCGEAKITCNKRFIDL